MTSVHIVYNQPLKDLLRDVLYPNSINPEVVMQSSVNPVVISFPNISLSSKEQCVIRITAGCMIRGMIEYRMKSIEE
jgi:hypothetical protein